MSLPLIPVSVSVSYQFQLVNFSPHFLLLCIPDKFLLYANIVNFTLLGDGYFCLLINILGFCSGL